MFFIQRFHPGVQSTPDYWGGLVSEVIYKESGLNTGVGTFQGVNTEIPHWYNLDQNDSSSHIN